MPGGPHSKHMPCCEGRSRLARFVCADLGVDGTLTLSCAYYLDSLAQVGDD
jgi:hypothetical protein